MSVYMVMANNVQHALYLAWFMSRLSSRPCYGLTFLGTWMGCEVRQSSTNSINAHNGTILTLGRAF